MAIPRGDLRHGDPVWLIPRTLAAPPVCYGQPRATIVQFDCPYVVVAVDGREYRIHEDNIQRCDPHRDWRASRPTPSAQPDGVDAWAEPPLW
jgi:hypothetical protein